MSKRSAWDERCIDIEDAFDPTGWVLRVARDGDDIEKSQAASSLARVLRKRGMMWHMKKRGFTEDFLSSRVNALHHEMRKFIIITHAVLLDINLCKNS